MRYLSLLRFKKIYVLLVVVFFWFMFQDVIYTYFTFDVNAPDLVGNFDGNFVKEQILNSKLQFKILFFDFGSLLSFFIPIIIVSLGYDYLAIKRSYVSWHVGKNESVNKRSRLIKLFMASIPVLFFIFIFIMLYIIGSQFGEVSYDYIALFKTNTIFYTVITSLPSFFLLYCIAMCVAIVVNVIVYFKILDYFNNFIRGALCYLGFIWLGSALLYYVLPYYLVPMNTLMAFSYTITILNVVLPYIWHIIIYSILSVKQNEF